MPGLRVTVPALLVAALLALAAAQGEEQAAADTPEHVVVGTTTNLSGLIADKIALVDFYAPWCGHCKTLAPEFEKAAVELAGNAEVVLIKVDATEEGELASEHGVQGYPTLKVFRDGKTYEYDGGRTADSIVSYMEEQAAPGWKPPPDHVLVLTQDNFTEVTAAADLMLVEFYAPWCGHCKQLAPELEKAAKELSKETPGIPVAKVDATAEPELGKEFDVTGYPTLKVFRKGVASDFDGGRDAKKIVVEMTELAQPAASLLETTYDVDVQLGSSARVVLAFFDPANTAGLEAYQAALGPVRKEFQCYYTFSDAVRAKYHLSDGLVSVFHPRYLGSKYETKAPSTMVPVGAPGKLVDFLKANAYPLVGHKQPKDQQDTDYETERPLIVVYFDVDFSPELQADTNVYRLKALETAKANPDIHFAVAAFKHFEDDLKALNKHETDDEFVVALYTNDGKKYLMEGEYSADGLADFVAAFKAGELKNPVIKSEPVPRRNDGPVIDVVGSTFDEIVMSGDKDVLIEFYAPWCGHCKSLAPRYTKLAKRVKEVSGIVVAKMDATANDVPPVFSVSGFPTIYLVPKGQADAPVLFEGDRTTKGFLKFLREKGTATIPKKKKKKRGAEPVTPPKEEL